MRHHTEFTIFVYVRGCKKKTRCRHKHVGPTAYYMVGGVVGVPTFNLPHPENATRKRMTQRTPLCTVHHVKILGFCAVFALSFAVSLVPFLACSKKKRLLSASKGMVPHTCKKIRWLKHPLCGFPEGPGSMRFDSCGRKNRNLFGTQKQTAVEEPHSHSFAAATRYLPYPKAPPSLIPVLSLTSPKNKL